jgi:hypothetical protein
MMPEREIAEKWPAQRGLPCAHFDARHVRRNMMFRENFGGKMVTSMSSPGERSFSRSTAVIVQT